MKTLRRIKLNSLSQEDLADREMNMLRGGSGWSGGGFRCGGRDVCLAEYTWSE